MKFLSLVSIVLLIVSCSPEKKENTMNANVNSDSALAPIDKLKAGNERFVSGSPVHPHETLDRIRELKKGQNPFAIIVSCSDSRIPPELIFDQGLGDIFSIRTAGNVIGDYELGSIEYAAEHLHCKLIVVMGHENCGAIQAFATSENGTHHETHLDHIQNLVQYLAAEDEMKIITDKSNIDTLVNANVKHGVSFLMSSMPVLKTMVDNNEIEIIGAYYDLDSGKVLFKE